MEKTEEDEREGKAVEEEDVKERMEIKVAKEEDDKHFPDANAGGGAKPEPGMGRLVMTIEGQQKQLSFSPSDLLSTATMFDGDRVRVLSSSVLLCCTQNTPFSHPFVLCRSVSTSPHTQRPKTNGPPM